MIGRTVFRVIRETRFLQASLMYTATEWFFCQGFVNKALKRPDLGARESATRMMSAAGVFREIRPPQLPPHGAKYFLKFWQLRHLMLQARRP